MGKNHNIYIATAVHKHLEKEPNKSGLINDLLLKHYGGEPSSEDHRHYPVRRDPSKTPPTQQQVNDIANMSNDKKIAELRNSVVDASSKIGPVEGTPEYAEARKNGAGQAAPDVEKPCCSKSAPCQHWTWDGVSEIWKNTLSGRERSNES